MDALRVSLLIIGGLLILAIYIYGRRNLQRDERRFASRRAGMWSALTGHIRKRFQPQPPAERFAPQLQSPPVIAAEELEELEEMIPDRGSSDIQVEDVLPIIELSTEQIAPAGEQLFIPLTLMAKAGRTFSGQTIENAVREAGLVLKDDGIYRYEVKDAQGYLQPLLGLANIIEPGTFDANRLEQLTTPGLVLYLHLPAPVEARMAFDTLIELGTRLAALLEGDLCDETRSGLTKQTIGHLKEKVEAFRFKQKMTQLQRRQP